MTRLLTRAALVILAVVTVIYLVAPIILIVPMAFSDSMYLTFPPSQYSIRWFETLFADPTWLISGLTSLQVAVFSTFWSVVLGVLAALGLVRGKFPFRGGVAAVILAPIIVPYVIVGLAAYIAFLQVGLTQTPVGLILIHTALAVPYVTINVAAGLANVNRDVERAAQSLGAGPITTFVKVTLPAILPSVLAGAVFAFITSWDEVVTAIFLTGPQFSTLPVRIWSGVKVQIDPTVAAISALTLFVILAAFLAWGAGKAAQKLLDSRRMRADLTTGRRS